MSMGPEEILFEEDMGFFLKKKFKKLGLGLVLMVIPPVALYVMFWYLIEWSSLFEKQTGAILAFLFLSPLAGLFFTVKGIHMRRMRIYPDRIPNPSLLGRWDIPLKDIESAVIKFGPEEPLKVEVHLRDGSSSTRDKHIVLGEFFENDRAEMMKAFKDRGVKTGLG
ncbi:MAG: hypothetical protein ACMUHM_00560 [Thermoplasmatota archaeon]